MEKYNPKAIVVFSAHWETHGHIEGISFSPFIRRITSVTDMTDLHGWTLIVVMSYEKNHLLYDYYNFPEEMYKVKFESKGSPPVAETGLDHDLGMS